MPGLAFSQRTFFAVPERWTKKTGLWLRRAIARGRLTVLASDVHVSPAVWRHAWTLRSYTTEKGHTGLSGFTLTWSIPVLRSLVRLFKISFARVGLLFGKLGRVLTSA